MEYLIRDFKEADIDGLINLCAKHAAYEQAAYDPQGKEVLLKNALINSEPKLHCWIVESKGALAGYATFTFDFSTWDGGCYLHLDCIYLEENFRGRGIGEEIMKRLKEVAAEKNCINVQWQTPAFNKPAIRFYERIGGLGQNKIRFSLPL